jgi:hypothetical protein
MADYFETCSETITTTESNYVFRQFLVTTLSYIEQNWGLIDLTLKISASRKSDLEAALEYAGCVSSFIRPFSLIENIDGTANNRNTVSFSIYNCPTGLTNPLSLIISNYSSIIVPGVPFYIFRVSGYKFV